MSKRMSRAEDTPAEEAARAPFPRLDVMHDLRKMILASADHMALVGSKGPCVDDFLGFEVGPWKLGRIPDIDPSRVDLARYDLTRLVNRAYDFAWQVGPRAHRIRMEEQDDLAMVTYIQAAPVFMSDSSDTPMARAASPLRQTLEAAWARRYLANHWPVSVKSLALLARMTEPAVRASLSKEGIRTTGEKNREGLSLVSADEALRWLGGRRGFVPTERATPTDGTYMEGDLLDILHDQGWGPFVTQAPGVSGFRALADVAQVDPEWLLDVIMGGAAAPDVEALGRVGNIVADDVPRFVGHAVERLMRAADHGTAPD